MIELNPPRGMRDIVGYEAELYEYLFSEFRNVARKFGFEPIITPTLEYFAVFEAKSGEEIRKSMYVFEDKSKRVLALRPEVTASVIRAYLKLMRARPKPIRLYYIAQCFRYEEPQHARYREFWQGGLEIIGDPDVNADLLVARTASEFLESIGLKHVYMVGNVAVYRAFMKKMGLPEEVQDHILHLIDKDQVDKALEEIRRLAGENGFNLLKYLISSNDLGKVEDLLRDYKSVLGELYEAVEREQNRVCNFIMTLKDLGYDVKYQPRLVRGLAYYTGLIFEYKVFDTETMPSIGGGGRYDGLTTVYEGPFEYATGLALGIDRIALAVSRNLQLDKVRTLMILVLGDVPLGSAYKILGIVTRQSGSIKIKGFTYKPRSLARGLEYGNKIGCDIVVIVGEREYREGLVTVKDMRTGEQRTVKMDDVLDTITEMLLRST